MIIHARVTKGDAGRKRKSERKAIFSSINYSNKNLEFCSKIDHHFAPWKRPFFCNIIFIIRSDVGFIHVESSNSSFLSQTRFFAWGFRQLFGQRDSPDTFVLHWNLLFNGPNRREATNIDKHFNLEPFPQTILLSLPLTLSLSLHLLLNRIFTRLFHVLQSHRYTRHLFLALNIQ